MILHNRNREEYSNPIFVKGNLSKYDVSQIKKAISQFETMRLTSEMKIASLQVSLMRVCREKGNCHESQSLIFAIKTENDFIKGFDSEISRYKDLIIE